MTIITRCLLWSVWLLAMVVILLIGSQDYKAVQMIPHARTFSILACTTIALLTMLFFGCLIAIKEREWKRQICLLRDGIAVQAKVTPVEGMSYCNVCACFSDGQKIREEIIAISLEQHYRFTYGEANHTILFHPDNPADCLLYLQIEAVHLTPLPR